MDVFIKQQTFAAHIPVCAECGKPYERIEAIPTESHNSTLYPCGHGASIKLIPNPALPTAG